MSYVLICIDNYTYLSTNSCTSNNGVIDRLILLQLIKVILMQFELHNNICRLCDYYS